MLPITCIEPNILILKSGSNFKINIQKWLSLVCIFVNEPKVEFSCMPYRHCYVPNHWSEERWLWRHEWTWSDAVLKVEIPRTITSTAKKNFKKIKSNLERTILYNISRTNKDLRGKGSDPLTPSPLKAVGTARRWEHNYWAVNKFRKKYIACELINSMEIWRKKKNTHVKM